MELQELKGKNWVAAMMLCWALGLYGGHRFYTGKGNSAWAMVALTILGITAPISAIWALIDGIMLALGKYKHADGSELYERINWLGYVYIALMVCGIILMILYFSVFVGMIALMSSGTPGM